MTGDPAIIRGEVLLAALSVRDATFPLVSRYLFSGDVVLFIALATVVVSVLALGNDYELGTVRIILTRGVTRPQFILSKVIATLGATLVNALAYIGSAVLSTFAVHLLYSDTPLFEAAGSDILLRALGAAGVVTLVGLVSSGIVMLALVLGRSAWMGMLAGLGYFFADFVIGGMGLAHQGPLENAYRYAITYYALSILERLFPSDPRLSMARSWMAEGPAGVWEALLLLLVYGAALTVLAIWLFRRQDLLEKI